MVVILTHNVDPFLCEQLHRIVRKSIGSGSLTPHQHAFYITPVQETLILDLLMFAQAVVTKRMNLVDIFDQRLLTWRGQMGILPVSLVKNKSLIQWSAVQQNVWPVNPDFPHAEIRTHLITNLSFVPDTEGNVIQIRLLR